MGDGLGDELTIAAHPRVPVVRPARASVARGSLDLRAAPDRGSELVDQALRGERVAILGRHEGWAYVQGEDGYFGWLESDGLTFAASRGAGPEGQDGTERIVVVHGATVRAARGPDAAVIDVLAPGTVVGGPQAEWIACGDGWLASADTARSTELPERPPTAADLLATAATFLGTPYLWGGSTAQGIDCSGLTQQVYRLNGVALPRDADQQAVFGRPVEVPLPGDLFFFGSDSVTHTAIATGPRSYIHAPRKGGAVEHGELGDERRLRAVRRYLL